ncbi:hypothetical protein C8J57DRAFT_1531775 [Mycena rebaudengoi]|nr:hypothetical protein C8J57DRAFT_1531775 [Mycena rebaudengoi]
MQFKTASLVAFAAWFAGAANASVLGARAATVANVFIHPVGDSTLCVTPSGFSEGNPVVFSPCTSSDSQNWAVITLDNSHVVQFQNAHRPDLCLDMQFDAFSGQVTMQSEWRRNISRAILYRPECRLGNT